MDTRTLGSAKIAVSLVGMGCMGLTHGYGAPLPTAEAARIIRGAFEDGYTFFDTAECYTGLTEDGTQLFNEVAVGAALAPVRDRAVIATKFGVSHANDRTLILDSSPARIRASIEGSLRRLGTDHVDLYYQHRIDPKVEPEEVAGVMAELIAEGKIRAWGISEATEEYLRRAHAVCPVAAVQNRLSCMARHHLALLPVLDELDIAFVAFSPIANGFLTASGDAFQGAQDYRCDMPQYTDEGRRRAEPLVELMAELAREHGATPAQVSLAWVLGKSGRIIPIPGSRKPERLRENLAAAGIALSPTEIERIDSLLDSLDILVFGGHSYVERPEAR